MDNLKMAVRTAGGRSDGGRHQDGGRAVPDPRQPEAPAGRESLGWRAADARSRPALAVKPKVLIADEMSLGLAPLVVDAVFDGLDQARKSGITVVLIEQFIHRALAMADQCVILQRGVVSWSGEASAAGAEVLDRYLGESVTV